jgi:hypothetical protein
MQVKKIDCNNSLPVPILFYCPVPGLYISSQATTNTDLCQEASKSMYEYSIPIRKYVLVSIR